jgi:RNA polymerase sigma-70 factor (ECF subfamily)
MDESPVQAEWRRWLDDHAPRFLLFARQKARCEADAQDLVQEAVMEAAQRISNGVPPPVALVYATIHRRAIDWARAEDRRHGRESAVNLEAPPAWFDTDVEERERANLIQEAMSRLPEIYREVVTLKIWAGLTFAEIADSLQIPANTAASRYRYGLEQLRRLTGEVMK